MKIIIVSAVTKSLVNFRGDLIKELSNRGHQIVAVAPDTGYEKDLLDIGAQYRYLPISRNGMNPFEDIALYFKMKKLFIDEKADVILTYLIKPVVYGSLAAKAVGVKHIFSMITGLGYIFSDNSIKAKILRFITVFLYKKALRVCENVFFQNSDDINDFVNMKIIEHKKCVLVNGSGVNMDNYKPYSLPNKNCFLMICRLIRDKGVMEYLQAANIVKGQYPDAVFNLLGPMDTNPNGLKEHELASYLNENVHYLGESEDVRPFIQQCRFFVLPSYYREGIPRTLLEAMAMRRPIITTLAPGCKETVEDEKNGFLIPVKNVDAIVEKMVWMIEHPSECEKMAEESFVLCKEKFDVVKINQIILRIILKDENI